MQVTRREALQLGAVAAAFGLFLPKLKVSNLPKVKQLNTYKLGKTPARPGLAKLKLRDYITPRQLPTPPENFGHEKLVPTWEMLGNDTVGDCAIAGPYHAIMLWNAEAGHRAPVSEKTVLDSYSTVTGYDPAQTDYYGDNPTDQGSDVQQVAAYWRSHGFPDDTGNVHKIDAYMALTPGDVQELFTAMYLFDGVGIGIACPLQWQQAFAHGQVWDELVAPEVVGGHYVLGVGRRAGMVNVVTWGRTQLITEKGYEQFSDEAFVYFSREKLKNGVDIDGFNQAQLLDDLQQLGDAPLHDEPVQEKKKPAKRKQVDEPVGSEGEASPQSA